MLREEQQENTLGLHCHELPSDQQNIPCKSFSGNSMVSPYQDISIKKTDFYTFELKAELSSVSIVTPRASRDLPKQSTASQIGDPSLQELSKWRRELYNWDRTTFPRITLERLVIDLSSMSTEAVVNLIIAQEGHFSPRKRNDLVQVLLMRSEAEGKSLFRSEVPIHLILEQICCWLDRADILVARCAIEILQRDHGYQACDPRIRLYIQKLALCAEVGGSFQRPLGVKNVEKICLNIVAEQAILLETLDDGAPLNLVMGFLFYAHLVCRSDSGPRADTLLEMENHLAMLFGLETDQHALFWAARKYVAWRQSAGLPIEPAYCRGRSDGPAISSELFAIDLLMQFEYSVYEYRAGELDEQKLHALESYLRTF